MKRALFYLALLAALGGLAYLALTASPGSGAGARRGRGGPRGPGLATAVPVEVASLTMRDLVAEGRFTGSLLPRSQFTVASKVAGRLQRLFVDIGDQIRSGTRIAEIEDEEYVQALAQARADLAIARANLVESQALLDVARRELDRVLKMRQQKVSSDAEVDAAQAQYDSRAARHEVNKASVAQKEAMVRAAEVRLGYTRLDVAWSGPPDVRYIGARFQDVGALLSPNAPIVTVLDLSTVVAVIDVVEREYFQIGVGQTADIRAAALPGQVFQGRVVRLAPLLDPVTRQARAEIEIPNPAALLKPGMFVDVRLTYARRTAVPAVPTAALVSRNNTTGVFQIDLASRTAAFIPIQTGIIQEPWAEVASPALTGPVVVLGQHLLEDGVSVALPGDAPPAEPARDGTAGRGERGERAERGERQEREGRGERGEGGERGRRTEPPRDRGPTPQPERPAAPGDTPRPPADAASGGRGVAEPAPRFPASASAADLPSGTAEAGVTP
ncbi:MAG: putative Co/Zn/Cd efflux system membrane fusion protein [Candidatus Ozemobacter sibiricus]|jgi:RND family efflux transporter MFP subunit|uniref:Putative Co/Zn/Cd efflux system membrane fusion protein n=1 Tax=Candidatus Ozemobacter sibiricus TaxID=2268124 RepID=A0A367ZTG0_9BACT|nr:MAG: putative Co/Zn/Cd efflux system membrane fusion protein [Candidatus Ozemobacter sibiricus]